MPDPWISQAQIFWWWDDAVREARSRATLQRQRMAVREHAGMWRVAPAEVRP